MIQGMLQKAWQFVSKALPDLDTGGMMGKAMEIGQSQASTTAVMSVLEGYARQKGYGRVFENNQAWNALKGKKPDEVIPYAQKTLNGMGKWDLLTSFFGRK